MVIEVVTWASTSKSHVVNQDWPYKTLCGAMIPTAFNRQEGPEAFPTCKRCALAVMKS